VCVNKNSDEVMHEELTPVEHSRGYFRVGVYVSRFTTECIVCTAVLQKAPLGLKRHRKVKKSNP